MDMDRGDMRDMDIERVLREHFKAEASELRAPRDPWAWVESRLEPTPRPRLFGRLIGNRRGPFYAVSGALAAAVVSVVAIVAAVGMWSAFIGPQSPAGDQGLQGLQGTQGTQGDQALLGFLDLYGPQGVQGSQSVEGPPGPQGPVGPQGIQGGLQSPEGPAGPPGPTGRPAFQVPPPGTTFRDFGRQPHIPASEDNVSTFSLDVDRTSYHLALNWARAGYEVEPDSVRAEEWVNAFDYDYDPPLNPDSFAIATDTFTHPLDSRKSLVRIAFQAPETSYQDRQINVTIVLDASGSMGTGNRVDIAREAAESIRRNLDRGDRIAIVHFTDGVIHDLTVEHSDPDDPAVRRSIDWLAPLGRTNVQAGLNRGVRLADQARRERPQAYNYIILMSDGVANVAATDPFAILESAGDRDSRNPLRLITIGVGIENYNDYLLEQLAQHGNGWYRYLSTVEQARETFSRDNWAALSSPFADQTRAQVTWDDDVVASWRIVGYENRVTSDESFTQARKEFAEIPSGAATTVFYELDLREGSGSDVGSLGDVELRWVTPSTGESNRQHATILSQRDAGFGALDDPLLKMGAIVALASDLYSSLPRADYADAQVHRGLTLLQNELWLLEDRLGGLEAYRDFKFLMEHITRDFGDSSRPSGYSR